MSVWILKLIRDRCETDAERDAMDMAIKALEAQDVDAISRQAVMWMLTNLSYTQCRTQGEAEVIGLAKTLLIAMPSAQEANNSTATQPNGIESQASYRQVTGKLDMTDSISRQMAIDAMTEAIWHYPNEFYQRLNNYEIARELAEFGLLNVPSAQPTQPNTSNTLKSLDCIDRQAAIDECNKRGAEHIGYAIAHLPSAQPEKLTGMIKEIRRWINSGNRGNADYFIVDKIEEIINEYEK